MASVDKIRNGLIEKILSIRNKEFLEALDKLIASKGAESDSVELTEEQKLLLQLSDEDVNNGRLISQQEMDKRNLDKLHNFNGFRFVNFRC